MKIHPVGAELFHEDRRRGRHDETKSQFSQICEMAYKPINLVFNSISCPFFYTFRDSEKQA
jgi:hypothetical protein